jgi:hypothetical protein
MTAVVFHVLRPDDRLLALMLRMVLRWSWHTMCVWKQCGWLVVNGYECWRVIAA